MIDFGKMSLIETHANDSPGSWTWKLGKAGFEMGLTAFNGAPEMGAFFAFLKTEYQINTAIETGTYKGLTTQFFALCFKEVHTIESVDWIYAEAKENLKEHPHVYCHLGSSEAVLKEILPSLIGKPVVFYLDAHWYNYWPIFDEIEAISKTHKDNCVIVIDDFKVPGRSDLAYDSYRINGNYYDCSYEAIEDCLEKVFTEYNVHFLIPEHPGARAKFVAIPTKFVKKRSD